MVDCHLMQVRHLTTLGGTVRENVLPRMMEAIITSPLATMFNWKGQARTTTKEGFAKTRVARVVIGMHVYYQCIKVLNDNYNLTVN